MALSMVQLVDLKRRKWQSKASSKLQNTKSQVLHQCLPVLFSRVFSSLRFRRKQERGGKNPSCSETTVAVEIPKDLETTVAVELPDDLVEEILHRLETICLLRLKSVSKGWKSLIESGHLAEKHLRLQQKKYGVEEMKVTIEWSISRCFRIEYISKFIRIKANNIESEAPLRVAGSCNGLVCVYDLSYVDLINPITKVNRTLAPPLAPPLGSKLSVGFGRDVVTGTYKVAVVYGFDNGDRVETIVFELGTNEWRWRHKTAGPMPHPSSTRISPERNPVFVNGSLFWLLTPNHSELLVMDLHTEKFRTLSQPNDIDVSSGRIYMWSLKARLCVSDFGQGCLIHGLVCRRDGLDSYVWVLVQDEVSERWERTRFPTVDALIPPLELNSAWLSKTLVSPYQSLSPETYRF